MITVKLTEVRTLKVGDRLEIVETRMTRPGRWEWILKPIETEAK